MPSDTNNPDTAQIRSNQDERIVNIHVSDSLNLLIFTLLLILVILTIWLFKHKRFPYIHETGLAIIYGMIMGIIIKYGFKGPVLEALNLEASNFTKDNLDKLPEYLHMSIPNVTQSIFVYKYKQAKRKSDIDTKVHDYEDKATFDPEIFFNVLLPPIIFHAGYSMKRKHFFKNFGAILLFAFFGTLLSAFCTGGFMYIIVSMFSSIRSYVSFSDCLFFGAIISATDPVTVLAIFNDQKVNVNLYALIFGESILNDAVSIILSQ
jgi:sodium/hydrogen exchanger-like protein 6/7